MDWLKSTNLFKYWVACFLEITVGAKQHTVFALLVNNVANLTLLSIKQKLAEVQCGCPAWLDLLQPHSLLDTKGELEILGGVDSIKVTGTDPLHWKLICSEFSDVLDKPGTSPERAIKYKIGLLPDSVPPANRQYRISPVELIKVRKQLDGYLSKGWIRPSTFFYVEHILFSRKKDGTLRMCIDCKALNQQTRPDKQPLPRIDDLLDQLVNANCLSSIYLHTGYHQVAFHPGDKYKTAF